MHISGNVHTVAVSLLCSTVFQFHQSHHTDSSCPHNPPHGHSSQCHSSADSGPWSVMVMLSLSVCILIHVYVYFGAFVYEFVWIHVFESIHACVFLFWGSYCFFFFTQKAPEIWRCVAAVTEKRRDSASRQRAVGRIQEELRSSNRQRAKRMTVPSSSRSVNTIIFEPGFRSKTRHTICKTVTKGKLHWLTELHGKEQTQPSQLWINSLKIQHNEIMKIKCSSGRYKQRIAHQQLCCSLVQYGSELPGKYPYEGMNRKSLLPKCDLPLLFFQLTSASSISQNKARWYQS